MTETLQNPKNVPTRADLPTNARASSTAAPRRHFLKCHPKPFRDVWDGRKAYEVRVDDRGYCVGDELVLREFEPAHDRRRGRYTGREVLVRVSCMTAGGTWGLPPRLCVLGIELLMRGTEISRGISHVRLLDHIEAARAQAVVQ